MAKASDKKAGEKPKRDYTKNPNYYVRRRPISSEAKAPRDQRPKVTTPSRGTVTLSPKMVDYVKLREAGFNEAEAANMAGLKDVKDRALRLREQKYRDYRIASEKNQELAARQLQRVLQAKPIKHKDGTLDYPTNSNILTAVDMVAARTEPVVRRNENVNVNVNLSPVDLGKYRQEDPHRISDPGETKPNQGFNPGLYRHTVPEALPEVVDCEILEAEAPVAQGREAASIPARPGQGGG